MNFTYYEFDGSWDNEIYSAGRILSTDNCNTPEDLLLELEFQLHQTSNLCSLDFEIDGCLYMIKSGRRSTSYWEFNGVNYEEIPVKEMHRALQPIVNTAINC